MSILITQEIKDNIIQNLEEIITQKIDKKKAQEMARHRISPLVSFLVNKIWLKINGVTYSCGNNLMSNTRFDFTVLEQIMEKIEEIKNNPTKQIIGLDDNDKIIAAISEHFLRDMKLEDIKIEVLFFVDHKFSRNTVLVEYKNGEIFEIIMDTPPENYIQSCYG